MRPDLVKDKNRKTFCNASIILKRVGKKYKNFYGKKYLKQ